MLAAFFEEAHLLCLAADLRVRPGGSLSLRLIKAYRRAGTFHQQHTLIAWSTRLRYCITDSCEIRNEQVPSWWAFQGHLNDALPEVSETSKLFSKSSLTFSNRNQGHYTYECTAAQQERPYISRPSRSQQLSNPKLAPKLSATLPPPDTKPTAKADAK